MENYITPLDMVKENSAPLSNKPYNWELQGRLIQANGGRMFVEAMSTGTTTTTGGVGQGDADGPDSDN